MKIRKLLPAIVWALFILVLMGTPGNYFPSVTTFWDWLAPDKMVHVFVFGILSFLILRSIPQQYFESKKRYTFVASAIGVALAYGLLTEVLQAHVFTGRNGNAYDFLADGIGAFTGWLAFRLVYRKKIKTYSNKNQD